MRTSERAYHQIRWDARLEPARFTLGVDVHRKQPKRIALLDFVPGGDIPWHRVLFIELEGQTVWDRTGVDTLDALASEGLARARPLALPGWLERAAVRWDGGWSPSRHPPEPPPDELRVLTWNVLWDRYDAEQLDSEIRWPKLIEAMLAADAHLVALQEVTPAVHALLAAHPAIRSEWWMSHPPGHPDIGELDLLLLGRVAVHQVAIRSLGRHKALLGAATTAGVVITTHLTSDHSRGAATTREGQLEVLADTAAALSGPLVVMGDFNCGEERGLIDAVDAWTSLQPAQATFDPVANPLARIATISGRLGRLDRIYVRGLHAHAARLLGTEPEEGVWLSDHAGVCAALRPQPPAGTCQLDPTPRSALAWLAGDLELEAVRESHDPSFVRWPAHVNVLWGFIEEARLNEVAALLARVTQTGFETRLSKVASFTHTETCSHGLVPDDPAPWLALHGPLRQAFPRCGRAEYRPHLTFARTSGGESAPGAPTVRGWVDRLAVMTRRGAEPFVVRAWVDGDGVEFVPEPVWPLGEPTPAGPLAELDGAVVVGSRALGCALSGADLDLIWPDADAATVEELLRPHVDELVAVEKAGVSGFRAWRGDLVVDASPGRGHEHVVSAIDDVRLILDAVVDREQPFRDLLRQVKGWARAQGIADGAWAGVEGLAWAVLAARTIAVGGADPLRRFFSTWGSWDWSRAVGLGGEAGPSDGLTVLTPSDGRPITRRADRDRVEDALVSAWQALEDGATPDDLLRPFPFHRRFSMALRIVTPDRISAGYARGRAWALLARTGGVPLPGDPMVLGVHEPDQALEQACAWAEPLPGVEVQLVEVASIAC